MTDLQIVEGLIVQPGDTLLIRVDPHSTRDYVEAMRRELDAYLPEHVTVVVVAAVGMALAVPPDGDGTEFADLADRAGIDLEETPQ